MLRRDIVFKCRNVPRVHKHTVADMDEYWTRDDGGKHGLLKCFVDTVVLIIIIIITQPRSHTDDALVFYLYFVA